MKEETIFRANQVRPFLKTLNKTSAFPIQQRTIRGDADYILCSRGFFVWLEIKTDEGEQDPLQKYKASCVKQTEGIVLVVRPSNWEAVKRFLILLDRGIYDKNELRAIEQHAVSNGVSKTNEQTNERPVSIQSNAHGESSTGRNSKDAGSVQKRHSIRIRKGRG